MKRFALMFLCLMLVVGLCACGDDVTEQPNSSSEISGDVNGEKTDDTSKTVTTGVVVVTDTEGTAVTEPGGALVTTVVDALPTVVRPVTDATGTATQADGTQQTEIVIPPYITVATDTQGNLTTSLVPEQTVTTTVTAPTSGQTVTTTGAAPTSGQMMTTTAAVPTSGQTVATTATAPTTGQTLTPSQSSSSAATTSMTSVGQASSSTRSTTASTVVTTTTTKPVQQETVGQVSLPAEGYTPDNRIAVGAISLIADTVTMEIKNISGIWQPEEGKSYFEYTCYDKNNAKLHVGKIEFGFIQAKSSKVCTFTIPEGTTKVELTDFRAEYWSIIV